jgi:hypothetical protein
MRAPLLIVVNIRDTHFLNINRIGGYIINAEPSIDRVLNFSLNFIGGLTFSVPEVYTFLFRNLLRLLFVYDVSNNYNYIKVILI